VKVIKPRAKRRPVRPAQIARAVDEGRESLDLYLDEISRVPLLNREEEMALAHKAFKGNVAAQEKLARHNVRFVVSVAKKFQNRGVPLVDLIGEGNLGLMTAARKIRTGASSLSRTRCGGSGRRSRRQLPATAVRCGCRSIVPRT
jgi:DNA-directed RNA polymerase sigma subunit (sigma70/sigma32)